MTQTAKKHAWVEIHRIALEAGERAPQVPADTQKVPLEMRVKGFLDHDATVGDEVQITTPAGRRITGMLSAVNPAYTHRFGMPITELTSIGSELRAILEAGEP